MHNNSEKFLFGEFNLVWVKTCISGKYLAAELPRLMPFQVDTLHSSLYTFFFAKCIDALYNIPSALRIQGILSL